MKGEKLEEKKESKTQDLIAIVMELMGSKSEISSFVTGVLLTKEIYYTGMAHPNDSYKIVTLLMFTILSTEFLIAYSSVINMLLFKGVYEPQ